MQSEVTVKGDSEQFWEVLGVPRNAPGEAVAEWFVRRMSHLARKMAQDELAQEAKGCIGG